MPRARPASAHATPAAPRRTAILLALGLGLAAAGCDARSADEPPPSPLPLGPVALANATVIVGPEGVDTTALRNGRAPVGEDGREIVLLPVATWGDLGGDERREAAAIVVIRAGGSAFYEVVVFEERGGRPVQVAHQFLGERVDVEGLAIGDGALEIRLQIHAPTDPPCCPSRRIVRRLRLQDRIPPAAPPAR
jgi:hypothetical protein